ncbi:hypothetical protein N0Y54_26010 [Nostoc punctiforme UO1]|uniref:hypothetical protein n=1 Tax=Nostoc punctiforme TaxID=272131 RepID=UPI0030A13221
MIVAIANFSFPLIPLHIGTFTAVVGVMMYFDCLQFLTQSNLDGDGMLQQHLPHHLHP